MTSEPPGEPNDGRWIFAPPPDPERKRWNSDLTEASLKSSREVKRADRQLETAPVGVLCNQPEILRRIRVGDEMEYPDAAHAPASDYRDGVTAGSDAAIRAPHL